MTVVNTVRSTGPGVLGWRNGSGGDGDGRRFVRYTSGLLVVRPLVVVVTGVCIGTLCACPYESGGDGVNPGHLVG